MMWSALIRIESSWIEQQQQQQQQQQHHMSTAFDSLSTMQQGMQG
jgi:hypothetical protein